MPQKSPIKAEPVLAENEAAIAKESSPMEEEDEEEEEESGLISSSCSPKPVMKIKKVEKIKVRKIPVKCPHCRHYKDQNNQSDMASTDSDSCIINPQLSSQKAKNISQNPHKLPVEKRRRHEHGHIRLSVGTKTKDRQKVQTHEKVPLMKAERRMHGKAKHKGHHSQKPILKSNKHVALRNNKTCNTKPCHTCVKKSGKLDTPLAACSNSVEKKMKRNLNSKNMVLSSNIKKNVQSRLSSHDRKKRYTKKMKHTVSRTNEDSKNKIINAMNRMKKQSDKSSRKSSIARLSKRKKDDGKIEIEPLIVTSSDSDEKRKMLKCDSNVSQLKIPSQSAQQPVSKSKVPENISQTGTASAFTTRKWTAADPAADEDIFEENQAGCV